MKVRELIEQLQDFDPNLEVHAAYQYGDYPRTVCATRISEVETQYVQPSEYHRDYKVVIDGEEYESDKTELVVVLAGETL